MFALTESAVSAIQKLAGRPGEPNGAGLRIANGVVSPVELPPGARALHLSFERAPHPGDRVLDARGALLFVAPGLAGYLDGKALDADVDDTGTVQFTVALPPR